MVEYGGVWWSMVEYGRVWWSMVEYGRVSCSVRQNIWDLIHNFFPIILHILPQPGASLRHLTLLSASPGQIEMGVKTSNRTAFKNKHQQTFETEIDKLLYLSRIRLCCQGSSIVTVSQLMNCSQEKWTFGNLLLQYLEQ